VGMAFGETPALGSTEMPLELAPRIVCSGKGQCVAVGDAASRLKPRKSKAPSLGQEKGQESAHGNGPLSRGGRDEPIAHISQS